MKHYDITLRYIDIKGKITTYFETNKGNNIINVITSAIERLKNKKGNTINIITINISELL